jgi:hypothetical protein
MVIAYLHLSGLTPLLSPSLRRAGEVLKPLSPGRGVWGEANKILKTVT